MPYQNHFTLVQDIYSALLSRLKGGHIPVNLRAPSLVGTVQDDPFDSWVGALLIEHFKGLEVVHAGKLTTPDIIVRDKKTKIILGLEVKKLIQKSNGADPRGNTLDFNSCLPCGTALIKVGENTVEIPCFYLFALLSPDSKKIVTLILMDGDFLNYDFNLHKEAKTANISGYNHGPYGEGSVRKRAMYVYPNPLNSKLSFFFKRKIIVMKTHDTEKLKAPNLTHTIHRDDKYGNTFLYSILDNCASPCKKQEELRDIFIECKKRKGKERVASMPRLMKD